ncbi:undecaprenyl-phosphate galactose phosphotransferase WbaP [Gulbenkiania mobilis]|uniref:Undecaprenyl-phosphate galactose phosphotransferase n=1 Tax=Gulbenkiania mobilis TaxID=397457 RepID=A0ABY2CZ44_GULMO|nr:undecaprenyl-phosphate galactose phosphotransferase [Gulbenkiania mobilis]
MSMPEGTPSLTQINDAVRYLTAGCCPPVSSRRLAAATLFGADLLAWTTAFCLGLLALSLHPHFSELDMERWWQAIGLRQMVGFGGFALVGCILFWRSGHYHERQPFWAETGEVMRTTSILALLYGVFVLVMNLPLSRTVWLAGFLSVLALVPLMRMAARAALCARGHWAIPAVVIGTGPAARSCQRALDGETQLGYRVHAFIESDLAAPGHSPVPGVPLLHWPHDSVETLAGLLRGYHIIYALEPESVPAHPGWLETLSQQFLNLHVVPPVSELPLVSMRPQVFFSHDVLMLRARNNLLDAQAQRFKRLFDIVSSVLLLALALPLLLVIALLIRLEGGPALFGQPRIGREGQLFTCLKFRTMRVDAEAALERLLATDAQAAAEWEAYRKLRNDPRITRVGAFLRKTSLDELPQLFNVLLGEMSLVGPRPRLPDEPACFYYKAVRPGLTGLWQVSGRNLLSYEDRISLDVWYVRNWNLWYDIAILFKTVKVVLFREGAY